MRAISLFSGVGGMDAGLERAGIETVLQCDLFDASHLTDEEVGGEKPDEKRRELTRYGQDVLGVLERHWPGVERVNDVRNVVFDERRGMVGGRSAEPAGAAGRDAYKCDLVHFGSPCQDLSVAGRRDGFVEGGRSHLFFEGVRVVEESGARFALWENVGGAFSSRGGEDFRAVLSAFTATEVPMPRSGRWASAGMVRGNGRSVAWRLVDARHFGVPQRRRRVFVVADFGGERAAEVLFEPEGGARPDQEGGAAGEGVAYALTASVRGTGDGHGNAWNSNYVANALRASGVGTERIADPLGADPLVVTAPTVRTQQRNNSNPGTEASMLVPTLRTTHHPAAELGGLVTASALTASAGHHGHSSHRGDGADNLVAHAVTSKWSKGSGGPSGDEVQNLTLTPGGVRRLTPRECERLMGWPDNHTRWTADGREVSDSHRYRMCGNGVVSPVAEWLGRRLMAVAS